MHLPLVAALAARKRGLFEKLIFRTRTNHKEQEPVANHVHKHTKRENDGRVSCELWAACVGFRLHNRYRYIVYRYLGVLIR